MYILEKALNKCSKYFRKFPVTYPVSKTFSATVPKLSNHFYINRSQGQQQALSRTSVTIQKPVLRITAKQIGK